MSDIMIDLETMGTGPTACIVAIGAVAMDVEQGLLSRFYTPVDLQSALDYGGTITASTVMWWLQQGDQARRALADAPKHIAVMLRDLREWMSEIGVLDDRRVWGNGADFDLPILASASARLGQDSPLWHHWNGRCYRTLKSLHRHIKPPEFAGARHNALADAEHQANHWVEIMRATAIVGAPNPTDSTRSTTSGMTLGDRIAHVGGVVDNDGVVRFGSPMALLAMVTHIQRDAARDAEGPCRCGPDGCSDSTCPRRSA